MAKKKKPLNLIFVLSSSVIVLSAAVISFSIHPSQPSTLPTSSSFEVHAYDTSTDTTAIKTANRKPLPNPTNIIDITNLQVGDQVGNVTLRELKPVDYLYSKTPQTDNFAVTFQGKIAIEGRYTDCFYPANSLNLPKFSDPTFNATQEICFDNPKTVQKLHSQLVEKSSVTIIIDNLTLSRFKAKSIRTATLLSVDTTK